MAAGLPVVLQETYREKTKMPQETMGAALFSLGLIPLIPGGYVALTLAAPLVYRVLFFQFVELVAAAIEVPAFLTLEQSGCVH